MPSGFRCLPLVALLVVSLAFSGCAPRVKTVTNLPTGVTQAQAQDWDKAVANLDTIANSVSSMRKVVIALNQAGTFTGTPYTTTLQVLGKIDTLEISAAAVLQQTPQNFSATTKQQVQALVTQISQQLTALNASGVTGIKDANTLQNVNTLIANTTAAVALILSL